MLVPIYIITKYVWDHSCIIWPLNFGDLGYLCVVSHFCLDLYALDFGFWIFSSFLCVNWPYLFLLKSYVWPTFLWGLFLILTSLWIFRHSFCLHVKIFPDMHTYMHTYIHSPFVDYDVFQWAGFGKFYFGHFLSIFRPSLSGGFRTHRP